MVGAEGPDHFELLQFEGMAARARHLHIEELDLALFGAPPDYDQVVGRIDQGFDELVFTLPDAGADKVLPLLDKLAAVAERARARG